jgi:hypothetical protein
MLLQILRSLERFATEVAFVRLERDVHANMRCDMITLNSCRAACTPLAGQVKVVGAFATDMSLTNVVLKSRSQLFVWHGAWSIHPIKKQ